MDNLERWKAAVAIVAVDAVEPGMVVGLGHGTTARYALLELSGRLQSGSLGDILGIPCSRQVEEEARRHHITLTTLEQHPTVDLTIDGADEVDPALNLIKGGGGALLREKIVAQASRRWLVVVDERKLSPRLGSRAVVPVEVLPFGWRTQEQFLMDLGARVRLRRRGDDPVYTDQGNLLLDCDFGPLDDAAGLARTLASRAGIVAHGLFLDMAREVLVAGATGVKRITK